MKTAISIIIAAMIIPIILVTNIISNINKLHIDTIKETFMLEKAKEFQESINT